MYTKFSIVIFTLVYMIIGCTSFSFKISQNDAEVYIKCLKSSEGKCAKIEKSEDKIAAISEGYYYRKGIKYEPISTAPRKNFKNPFSEESHDIDFLFTGAGEKNRSIIKQILYKQSEEVRSLLESPSVRKLDEIYNKIWMSDASEITIDAKSFYEFRKKISEITESDGWSAWELATAIVSVNFQKDSSVTDAEKEAAIRDARAARLFREYIKAYFRNGKFATVQLSLSDFVSKFPLLEKYPPEILTEIKKALEKVDQKLKFGRIGEEGFVTRFGAKYAFPAIELQLSPAYERFVKITELDYVQIGNDLIRVFIEALFDGLSPLPGVPEATGVKTGPLKSFFEVKADYPLIDDDDFTKMNAKCNEIESIVTTVVSKVIRGFSFFSINNETIETLIENVIAITARKVGEKFSWCWYSCGLHFPFSAQQVEKLNELYYKANIAVSAETGTIRERVENKIYFNGPIGEARTINFTVWYWGL